MGIVQKENEHIHPLVSRTMRIWDLPVSTLCRAHLLGEHRELHAIWVIITKNRHGYARHPETMRWRGKLQALYKRHECEVIELKKRGYLHRSPLDTRKAKGLEIQLSYVDEIIQQKKELREKKCLCRIT